MDARTTRRGMLGTAAALTALGSGTAAATAAGPRSPAGSAALPPVKDRGRRQGSYQEQVLAAPGDSGSAELPDPGAGRGPQR